MARHGKELTTEQKEMLLSLSHQGFSSNKIQEFTGINCRNIQKFLKRTREKGSIENNPRSGGRKKNYLKGWTGSLSECEKESKTNIEGLNC